MREAPSKDATARPAEKAPLVRPGALPPKDLPVARGMAPQGLAGEFIADDSQPGDTLSETEILNRISRIYRLQADVLKAQADGNNEQAERLLELAMTELSTLLQHPGVMDRPRFSETYRSVIGEYETYYGVSADSLNPQYGDIFQLRADMFAGLNEVDHPLLEDVMLPKLQPAHTVVEMTMNRLVEQSIAYLMRTPEKHLYKWMSRAETYFPMIEQILREEGVPDEIKYLAMIESGLNPFAQSWAQAVGMWQFIAGTGRMYGLNVNTWVDERRDPEKATRAAARHLRDLNETFGDWQLALAAYNCGAGNVSKALRRLGRQKASFWEIWEYLPKETRGYVPMYIAAALVASNPDAFNLPDIKPGPRYEYHYVPIRGSLSLAAVADMTGADVETIKALNPELRRNALPPSSKAAYPLRIPMGTYDQFAQAYSRVPDSQKRVTTQDYVVRRGDSLGKIAKQHGMSTTELKEANNLRSTTLKAGQRLIIPVPVYDGSAPLAELAEADVLTVKYGERAVRPITGLRPYQGGARPETRNATPVVNASDTRTEQRSRTAAENAPAARETNADTRVTYTVRRGDSLGKIADKYGVTVTDIKEWNGLRSSTIRSGQKLKLYSSGSSATTASASARAEKITYKVRRGDSLGKIADKYGVTVESIKEWNGLHSSTIRSGQRLTIYSGGSASRTVEAPAKKTITYKVRRGDNLTEIARKHGVTVDDIKRLNGLRSNTIRTGQRLKIQS